MQSASALTERDPAALGPYVLLGRVADGGMGVVYLGRDGGRPDSLVAVKTLKPGVPADSLFRSRLRHEIEVARALTRLGAMGSSVARLVDADDGCDRPWLAWEYVPGPSLHSRASGSPLDPSEVRTVALELATAITLLHDAGYAHCDIKPANVVLGPDGLRLVDLGLAHDLCSPAAPVAMGSPGWSPPEQSSPARDGAAVDVHGWGMCVAFAATGANPFGAGHPDVVRRRMLSGNARLGGLDVALRPLVVAALAADPDRRPTMTHLTSGLRAIAMPAADAITVTTAAATAPSPSGTEAFAPPTLIESPHDDVAPAAVHARPRRRALTAVATAVALLLVGSWWLSRPSTAPAAGAPKAATSASPSATPSGVVVPVAAKAAPTTTATPPVPVKAKAKPHGKGKGKGKAHR